MFTPKLNMDYTFLSTPLTYPKSVSNAKAGAYAPRFNTQRTYYRCLFHKEKAPPSASKGIRARTTRQPLSNPCPFTMSVVANYAADGTTVVSYTIDRTSTYDRCPDHTHTLDLVDETHRCDGLRAIAHHKMWQMAPDAKASVVFQSMKELPRFEDVGGKHFLCSEVYYIGMKFRKPTDAVAAKNSTATEIETPNVEVAETQPPGQGDVQSAQEEGNPPSWLEAKNRKRKRAQEARPPPKPQVAQGRYRPASTTHTLETSQENHHTTANRDDLLAHYRQPNQSTQPRQPPQTTGEQGRYSRDTPPGDIASRVRAILSRPNAGAEHSPAENGYTPPPIDLTSSPGYDPPPPQTHPHPWYPPHNPSSSNPPPSQPSQHSNTILPNWMTASGPSLLQPRSVQKGRSAILVEAPVSIGDLLRKTVPHASSSSRQDVSTGPRNGRDVESAGMGRGQTTNERATLRELLSMQQ
jgi:hypothetical protein